VQNFVQLQTLIANITGIQNRKSRPNQSSEILPAFSVKSPVNFGPLIGCLHDWANIEQTSSWLKQAYWNVPASGSNV